MVTDKGLHLVKRDFNITERKIKYTLLPLLLAATAASGLQIDLPMA
jgi:hypothetical protein